MELLDRYLQAVAKHLPRKRQEDIIAELRANLESQLDEKQAELGRSLNPTEAEDWVRQLGSPTQMASHYQPQRYLIGPAVFPAYLHVLRLSTVWAAVVYALVSTVTLIAGASPSATHVAGVILRLPFVLLQVVAWITLAFAIIEYAIGQNSGKCPDFAGINKEWSPRDLPPLELAATEGRKSRPFSHAITEVVFGFAVLVWLFLVPERPFLMFGPGVAYLHASPFKLAPVWTVAYWWIVGLNAAQLTWRCVDLFRGAWQKSNRAQHMVVKAFGLIPLLILASVHDGLYVLLKRPDLDLAAYGKTIEGSNQGIHTAILVVCVIVSVQLAWDVTQAILAAVRKCAAAS
jgi:hypothetical protein